MLVSFRNFSARIKCTRIEAKRIAGHPVECLPVGCLIEWGIESTSLLAFLGKESSEQFGVGDEASMARKYISTEKVSIVSESGLCHDREQH
ncbi:hypothetical protein GCM10009107_47450 [Ideonella azotifigens]|uniref:Uncharacterized protein n=1 Tax=Ideonella azotifigens TaxID=513160 RepID=A0ABP3VL07_9BURK